MGADVCAGRRGLGSAAASSSTLQEERAGNRDVGEGGWEKGRVSEKLRGRGKRKKGR